MQSVQRGSLVTPPSGCLGSPSGGRKPALLGSVGHVLPAARPGLGRWLCLGFLRVSGACLMCLEAESGC